MEKHISKKLLKGFLALSAGFILASCDPARAVPSNYNDKIVATTEGEIDLKGNNLGSLYDAISSDKNSKAVEKMLSEVATNRFGKYSEFLSATSGVEAKRDEFIQKYSSFFGTDANKVLRFNNFKADIESRISEYFYNEITSGSYNDELGRFSEEKLYNAKRYELYDLHKLDESVAADKAVIDNVFFVDKDLKKDKVFDSTQANYLKGVYYNTEARGYIEEKVYPEILRNKLVEDYIYENNLSSLGRAYARKVNYVKISYEEESTFEEKLVKEFAKKAVEVKAEDATVAYNFERVVDAQKGFVKSTVANTLIQPVSGETELLLTSCYSVSELAEQKIVIAASDDYKFQEVTIIPAGTYYKETKLGKILLDYEKAIKAETDGRFPSEENKTALEQFTGDGKSKQYGLLQKVISLLKEDTTTDGWYVKNGGIAELPSKIRDRLFSVRTAMVLDDSSKLFAENSAETLGKYEEHYENANERIPYLRNIYGKKLIINGDLRYEADPFNYIWNDADGKAYYMVEVLEAPSTAKLADSSTDYASTEDPIRKEEIARQVAKVLGTKDSYIKDAYTSYLSKYTFVFNDTSLYEYMKGEYPDLFDEE